MNSGLTGVGAIRALVTCLALLMGASAGAQDGNYDRWYRMLMMDAPAGWMRAMSRLDGDVITATSETRLSIKRGTIELKIRSETEFVERTDGTLVSGRYFQEMGAAPVETLFTFKPDRSAEVITRQQGNETKRDVKAPEGAWLTPEAARRFMLERLQAGEKEISLRTIDITQGFQAIDVKRSGITPVEVDSLGRKVKGWKCQTTISLLPGVTTEEVLDENGISLSSETPLGAIKMQMIAASREEALGPIADLAPEMMITTLVKPDKPIENARDLKRAQFIMSVNSGSLPEIPISSTQQVEAIDGTSARVTVDVSAPEPAPTADTDDARYLGASVQIDVNDEKVKALAAEAVKDAGPSDAERAEACRRFVNRHIRAKGLGVAYATASEVARNCEGDCSEHGVLLAALLRANGIPARVAVGLLYVDDFLGQEGIFGYHMWGQALLERDGAKRWVDLDAVLDDMHPSDATHIALGYTPLADGEPMSALMGVAMVMGKLKIVVESAE